MRRLLPTLALLAGAALAATLGDAQALYASGRLQEAAAAAAALGTAPALTLAARASNVLAGTLPARDQEGAYRRAHDYASRAIGLDARFPPAYLERARATGRIAEMVGPLRALADGSATRARDDLETALRLDPRSPDAMVGLGAWHARVAAAGAAWLYGADAIRVQPYFEEAIRLSPRVIAFRVEYAVALRALGKPDQARAQVEAAVKLTPDDYAERLELERARKLLAEYR
ncbi:MAG TPA: tetratricopeptide repeat protein [Deinococcales bacterium]|nr:tetratricopeptide repeat protein [Deinococcales bacterium]